MIQVAFKLCLVGVGLINLAPVLGVLSAAKLEQAYAVSLLSEDLILLMRHRALLFGLLGGFVLCSVLKPQWQWPAMVMAGISMLGFVVIDGLVGPTNESIQMIVLIDWVGIALLVLAVILKIKWNQTSRG